MAPGASQNVRFPAAPSLSDAREGRRDFFSPPWEPLRGEEIGFWYFFLIFFSRPFHTNSRDFRNAEKSEPVRGSQGLTLGGGPSHCNARGKCGGRYYGTGTVCEDKVLSLSYDRRKSSYLARGTEHSSGVRAKCRIISRYIDNSTRSVYWRSPWYRVVGSLLPR